MAVYKVPQDVEAEDKLIGPFGFRQFIYLIIVAFACFVAYILSQIFIGLILIPMPFILFFAAIALPLRKDQPTETYLAAILQYHLRPKKRMWMPDGVLSTVEITAPKMIEVQRTKNLTQDEALDKLEHLSQIMDTRGWAARGVFNPTIDSTGNTSLVEGVVAEADNATDILEKTSFDKLIDQQKAVSQKEAKERMQKAATSSKPTPVKTAPKKPEETFKSEEEILKGLKYDPYPSSMHQSVLQPIGSQASNDGANDTTTDNTNDDQTSKSTSDNTPSADIINLVDNSEGLKVSTIAKQASRLSDQQTEEVEIKLH
ncbi:MAG: PrgI family protein [Patescibacteria group bacterium]